MVKKNWDIRGTFIASLLLLAGAGVSLHAFAQAKGVKEEPQPTGSVPAVSGVATSELAANAPNEYTVKEGDTLWALSGLFLKSPWRWSQLWGMNRTTIQNPHLIYPGQVLRLVKEGDRASLSTTPAAPNSTTADTNSVATAALDLPAATLSPTVRTTESTDKAIPTVHMQQIAPFFVEPILVDENTLTTAPRLVAIENGRVVAGKGDKVYALSSGGALSLAKGGTGSRMMRVVRNATPLKQFETDEILAYESQYIARVRLLSGETTASPLDAPDQTDTELIPATLEVVYSKEELRVGDRLIPEAEFEVRNFAPKAPNKSVVARVLSIHSSALANASQNQVLSINKGLRDGLVAGDVLTFLSLGERLVDRTNGSAQALRLPNEKKGWAIVFRVFEKVAYVLVLESKDGIRVGDYLVNPN